MLLTRRYSDADAALDAQARLAAEDERRGGALELSIYAHGPPERELVFVTVVSHRPDTIVIAERVLGGEPHELGQEEAEMFLRRRS